MPDTPRSPDLPGSPDLPVTPTAALTRRKLLARASAGVLARVAASPSWPLAVGAGMAASAGLAEIATPRQHLAERRPCPDLRLLFPPRLEAWTDDPSQPRPLVAPEVDRILRSLYQQTLTRSYRSADDGLLMLAVAYGGDQSDATRTHRPEVCYPAQGFEIGAAQAEALPVQGPHGVDRLPLRRLQARLGPRREAISWWMTVGDRAVSTSREQKWAQLAYGLRGWVPDGLLVRVSTLHAQGTRAWPVHDRFLAALAAWMSLRWPGEWGRVFGGEAARGDLLSAPGGETP